MACSNLDQVVPQQQQKKKKKNVIVNVDECVQTIYESIESVLKYTTNENFRQKTIQVLKVDGPSSVGDALSFYLRRLTESTYYSKAHVHSQSQVDAVQSGGAETESHCVPDLTPTSDTDDYFEQLAFNNELY